MDDYKFSTDDELDSGGVGVIEFDDSGLDDSGLFGDEEFASEDVDGFDESEVSNDGTIISPDYIEKSSSKTMEDRGFISDTGDIVVMDTSDGGESFKLIYVDIENIAIVRRIRNNNNVEDLVRSIKSTGLLQPITVAPTATEGLYVLLNGYRRILACAKAGKRKIPCIVNNKVNTPEIPILEAMYNHNKHYTIKEMIAYIDYLEKQKGILSASMIEYLLQMDSGDYTKLKDILNDGDDEIVSKLMDGTLDIKQAFAKLEKRRKKESSEEKDNKKAVKAYGDGGEASGENIVGKGEEAKEEDRLSDDEIKNLLVSAGNIDEGLGDQSLSDMVEKGKQMKGFEPHRQDVNEREYLDPAIRKAVLARDENTCVCCKRGGEAYISAVDCHHIVPVSLGGKDDIDNCVTVCLNDHNLIHSYSVGDLYLPKEKAKEELESMDEEDLFVYNDEIAKFKRIVKLGGIIREGMIKRGIKKEEFKKNNPVKAIGRNKPGRTQTRG